MSKSSKNKKRNDRRRKVLKAKSQEKATVATLELKTVLVKPTVETTVLPPDSPNLSADLAKTGSDFSVSPLAESAKIAEELEGKAENVPVAEALRLQGFDSRPRISRGRYFSQPPLGPPVGDARQSLRSRRHSGDGWDTFTKCDKRTILREAEGETGLTRCGMIWRYMESFREPEKVLLPSEGQCSEDAIIAKVNSSASAIDINKSEIKPLEHEDIEKSQSLKVWNVCEVETLLRLDLSDKEPNCSDNDQPPTGPIIGVSISIEDLMAASKVTEEMNEPTDSTVQVRELLPSQISVSLEDLFSAATATAKGAASPIQGQSARTAQHGLGSSVSMENLKASARQAIENEVDFGSLPEDATKYLCREPVQQHLMNGSLRLDHFLKSMESLQSDRVHKVADVPNKRTRSSSSTPSKKLPHLAKDERSAVIAAFRPEEIGKGQSLNRCQTTWKVLLGLM
ncbi:hypothetical protein HDU97_009972 [Phlyctochytrium planicorne]|nr:hypothetical protein HDU97_009972 [Phlyctochytrium planicorne]